MGLSMKKILEIHSDCDKFSLTGPISKEDDSESYYEFLDKLKKATPIERVKLEEQRTKYFTVTEKEYDEALNEYREYTKKHGKDHVFYKDAHNIILEKLKTKYCNNGMNPIEQVPEELKKCLLYHKVSFYNPVSISKVPLINYYFELNDEAKKYLLKFRNDFDIQKSGLEDLALYKDNELKFASCSHEERNTERINYKDLSPEELEFFVQDEYPNKDITKCLEAIHKLIDMKPNTKFKFTALGITTKQDKAVVCTICSMIELGLTSVEKKDDSVKDSLLLTLSCDCDDIILSY